MEISAPSNWQNKLIENLHQKYVVEIYGKLEKDFIGGGRAAICIPPISRKKAVEHIRLIHKKGIKFNYLLNAPCLGNKEWTAKGQRQIRLLLDWLTECEVDSVTVSMPYLLQLIKKAYPHFQVNISVIAGIDSAASALQWEELGADQLTLSLSVNRDFAILRSIRSAVHSRLQLIGNSMCLYGCPFFLSHHLMSGHASQDCDRNGNFHIDYCFLSCEGQRLKEGKKVISSCWIRPEDLQYYAQAGINRIKLIDRNMETSCILKIIEAYAAQKYEGNLIDLFLQPFNFVVASRRFYWKRFTYLFHPFKAAPRLINAHFESIVKKNQIYLDNCKLDGFLTHFLQGRCHGNCSACSYCEEIAAKAVSVPEQYRKMTLAEYKKLLEDITGGSLFYQKGSPRINRNC